MCIKGILQLFMGFYLQRKFSIFLRNDSVCTRRKFPMNKKKIWIQQENSYKINFPTTNKKNDTTAQLYCTLSTYVTPKTISRSIPKQSALNIYEKQSWLYGCRSIQSKKELVFSYVGFIGDQFFYKESSRYFWETIVTVRYSYKINFPTTTKKLTQPHNCIVH